MYTSDPDTRRTPWDPYPLQLVKNRCINKLKFDPVYLLELLSVGRLAGLDLSQRVSSTGRAGRTEHGESTGDS